MQIVPVTIAQTNGTQVFKSAAEAQEFVDTQLAPGADDGETFVVNVDPKGSGRAVVEIFFNGKSEGLF